MLLGMLVLLVLLVVMLLVLLVLLVDGFHVGGRLVRLGSGGRGVVYTSTALLGGVGLMLVGPAWKRSDFITNT